MSRYKSVVNILISIQNVLSFSSLTPHAIDNTDDDKVINIINLRHLNKVIIKFGLSTTQLHTSWVAARVHVQGPEHFTGLPCATWCNGTTETHKTFHYFTLHLSYGWMLQLFDIHRFNNAFPWWVPIKGSALSPRYTCISAVYINMMLRIILYQY